MKSRRIISIMITILMLISMMPTATAMSIWCPDEGLDHSWGPWRGKLDVPCGEEGIIWRECTRCGAGDEETYYREHELGAWIQDPNYSAPTCTEGSMEIRICSICGEAWDEREVDPLGHNWGEWHWAHDEEADCTHGAWQVRECKRCGSMEDKWVASGDHKWGAEKTESAATCIKPGVVSRTCTVCGEKESWETDYGSHKWGDWKLVEKGDCTHPGKEEKKCSLCGETQTRETEEGSHDWGSWSTEQEAECVKDGKETRECSLCGKEQSRDIDALGHKWGAWVVIQEPDPNGQVGIRERKCSRCGKTEREEFYPEGTIQKGDRGDDVEDLQEALNDQGYDCGKADGIFGNNTENALEDWQADNGFTPDGIFWPGQRDELLGDDGIGEYTSDITLVVNGTLPESIASPSVGDTVTIPLLVSNTGDTQLYIHSLYSAYSDNTYAEESVNWNYGWEGFFDPASSFGADQISTITQHDIDAGEFYREFGVTAAPQYYTGTDVLSILPIPDGHDGSTENRYEENVSAEVVVCIPFTLGGNENFQYVTVEKSITSTPANGEYYVLGETISFLIKIIIPEGKTITDLEVTDPLKGGNEDATLDIMPTATSADNTEYVFNYVVTAEDVERGYVENSACAYFFDPEGDAWVEEWSETVGALTSGESQQGGIVLTKSVVSTAEYYFCGDTVTFEISIENTSDETYYDVTVYDPILEFAELKTYDVMEPGFSDTIGFTYTVTNDDVLHGSVENTAFVIRPGGADSQDRIYSNTVSVLTAATIHTIGGTDYHLDDIDIVKSVLSTPANGAFYLPGETVTYQVDVTNTHGTMSMLDVVVTDPLMLELGGIWECMYIEPGMTESFTFNYVVTPIDAVAGIISNIAKVEANIATGDPLSPKGAKHVGISNKVTVLTGMPEDFPFGVITDMSIVKEETSTPANGSYYTEGETISYKITYTNIGETAFGETLIYDTLKLDGDEIASAEMLNPGESRTCTFSYVVTADDVAKGYVANSAIAKYDIGGGYTNTAISNVVVSDTDGDPNTTYIPGTGTIDWEKLRGKGTDANGNALPEADTCYIKAVSRDGDSVEYEVHFCTKHAKTQNAILTMAEAAATPERQQMAWEYAYALWQKEIDAMYQKILPACDDAAKITVMSERVTHLSMVANTQLALKIAEPGQPAETARAVAELWQDKCIDLCYLMNNAPSERLDSIFAVERAQNEAEIYETCSCVITEEAEGKLFWADQYCPVHGFTYEMAELLLLSDNSPETWATVRSLWEIELNTVYNDLYKDASEEGGMAYLVEYAAYIAWLPAYEQFITMVYPENPEIVAEVMVNTIMERVLDGCERMK